MKRLIKARVAKILLISILFTQNGILEIPGAVEDMNTAQIESPDSKATKIVATSSNIDISEDNLLQDMDEIQDSFDDDREDLILEVPATSSNAGVSGDRDFISNNKENIIFSNLATASNAYMLRNADGIWDGITEKEIIPIDNTYYIRVPAELAWVRKVTNEGTEDFDGKTISILNDLDMGGYEWEGIGNSNNPFKGSVEGNNYTIYNIKQENQNDPAGIFAVIEVQSHLSISNLKIDRAEISGNAACAGILAGQINLKSGTTLNISNVNIQGMLNVSGCFSGGGLAGIIYGQSNAKINIETTNVSGSMTIFYTAVNNSITNTGGFIGYYGNPNGDIKICDSSSSIDISTTAERGTGLYIGGIIGDCNGRQVELNRIYAEGTLRGKAHSECTGGGLIGGCEADTLKMTNSYMSNTVGIDGINSKAGGLVGYLKCKESYKNSKFTNCHVSGQLGANQCAAFIVMNDSQSESVEVEYCYYNKSNSGLDSEDKKITHLAVFKTYKIDCPNGYGITRTEMEKESSFMGWDFNNVWEMQGNGYPQLRENAFLYRGLIAGMDSEEIWYSDLKGEYETEEIDLHYSYSIDKDDISEEWVPETVLAQIKITLPEGLSFSKDEVITEAYMNDGEAPLDYVYVLPDEVKSGNVKVFINKESMPKESFRLEISIYAPGFEVDSSYTEMTVHIKEDTITEIVKRYTTGRMLEAWKKIEEEGGSTESKARKLKKLFVDHGISDPLYGMAYVMDTKLERNAYHALTSNEMYCAYQYKDYLHNTLDGNLARIVLAESGLVFNNEIDKWQSLDTLQGETPGVSQYKKMLQEFIYESSSHIESINYSKKILSILRRYRGYLETAEIAEIESILNREVIDRDALIRSLKRLLPKVDELTFDKNTGTFSCSLRDSNFSKALGYADDAITLLGIAVDEFNDYMDLSAKIDTYRQYEDFLKEIAGAREELPFEMRMAAALLLKELDNGYFQPMVKALKDVGDWSIGKLDLPKFKVDSYFKLVTYAVKVWADVAKLTEKSKYTEGYGFLGEYFAAKLKKDEERFLENQNEKNAYEFFYDYILLYEIRLEGEKAYRNMSDMKGAAYDLYKAIFKEARYQLNIDVADEMIEYLKENCQINTGKGIIMPEEIKYDKKLVVECPVDVIVRDLSGKEVCYLTDGVESDVTNEYGRFAVWYDSYSKDYGKSICLFSENDVEIQIVPKSIGIMSIQVADKAGDIYKISNEKISEGEIYLIKLSDTPVCFRQIGDDDVSQEVPMVLDNMEYVAVSDIHVQNVIYCKEGDEIVPSIVILPENSSNQWLSWFSDDESIATVFNGKIKALAAGQTEITMRTQDGYVTKSFTVVVDKKKNEEVLPDRPQDNITDKDDEEVLPDTPQDSVTGKDENDYMDSGQQNRRRTFSDSESDHASVGIWKKDSVGWWYQYKNGTWPSSCWKYLDWKEKKNWYHFNRNGYMQTGWILVNDRWYYLDKSGAMATGWIFVDNKWYYLKPDGAMAIGWILVNDKWYYLSQDGSLVVAATTPDGYKVGEDGAWIP